MEWKSSAKQTENGDIPFHFTYLSPLRNEIQAEPVQKLDLSDRTKAFSVAREYATDFITLFHATGDFAYRSQWLEGVKKVVMVDHYLPRVGMRCKAELENGEAFIYSSSYFYSEEKLEFSETNETDKTITVFTIDILAPKRSRLTIDYYVHSGFVNTLLFNLFKKNKLRESFARSLEKLDTLAMTLVIPA
jgi:hypothetical protein